VTVAVQTPVFEGPFDLLLHLILADQVDLYEVSLTSIVDAYLGELEKMEALDLELATEFLLIAATLIELKSKRLLPGDPDIDLDDELALWEERDLLLARLLECKTFKDAARAMRTIADTAGRSFPRITGPDEQFLEIVPDLLAGITGDDLRQAFLRATAPKPVPLVDLNHVQYVRASVTDAVAELLDELPRVGRITFRELTESFIERIEVVVRFLAVLELFKQGFIELDQPEMFGSLVITWRGGVDLDEVDGIAADALALVDSYEG
jgi:segregation and condensation protein A